MNEFTEFLKHAKTCQDALDKESKRLDARDTASWEETKDKFNTWVVPLQQALEQVDINKVQFDNQYIDHGKVLFNRTANGQSYLSLCSNGHAYQGDYYAEILVYSDDYKFEHGWGNSDTSNTNYLNKIMEPGIEYYLGIIKKGVEKCISSKCSVIESRGGCCGR